MVRRSRRPTKVTKQTILKTTTAEHEGYNKNKDKHKKLRRENRNLEKKCFTALNCLLVRASHASLLTDMFT